MLEIAKDIHKVAYFGESKLKKSDEKVIFVLQRASSVQCDFYINPAIFLQYQYVPEDNSLVLVGSMNERDVIHSLYYGGFVTYVTEHINGTYGYDTVSEIIYHWKLTAVLNSRCITIKTDLDLLKSLSS